MEPASDNSHIGRAVAAAGRLHARLSQWSAADAALELLRAGVPGFDRPSALLKVAAVNQLYGTNVLAVTAMADHVSGVMKNRPGLRGVELVEQLSAPKRAGHKPRRHLSFASKFVHFFVSDSVPIYDSYALLALRRVSAAGSSVSAGDYPAYAEAVARLVPENGDFSIRDVDRYLWLAGLWLKWSETYRREGKAPINVEVKNVFLSSAPGIKAELKTLTGPVRQDGDPHR